jgi:hypothetical protein
MRADAGYQVLIGARIIPSLCSWIEYEASPLQSQLFMESWSCCFFLAAALELPLFDSVMVWISWAKKKRLHYIYDLQGVDLHVYWLSAQVGFACGADPTVSTAPTSISS